jgi:cell division protein FtsN
VKKLILLIFLLSIGLMSCGSKKKMNPSRQSSPATVPATRPQPAQAEVIPVIAEKFEFEHRDDELNHQVNHFFVILGSFNVTDNAGRFRKKLEGEGFDTMILLSETGLNRVCVGSFTREDEARMRVMQIRSDFPEYYDSWLLIRK